VKEEEKEGEKGIAEDTPDKEESRCDRDSRPSELKQTFGGRSKSYHSLVKALEPMDHQRRHSILSQHTGADMYSPK